MKFAEIKAMPRQISSAWCAEQRKLGALSFHESLFRPWGILQKVKELVRAGVPAEPLLEIIAYLEEDTKGALTDLTS